MSLEHLHRESRPATTAEIKIASGQFPQYGSGSLPKKRFTPQNPLPETYQRARATTPLDPSILDDHNTPKLFHKQQDQRWTSFPAIPEMQAEIEALHDEVQDTLNLLDQEEKKELKVQLKKQQVLYNYRGISQTAAAFQNYLRKSPEDNPHSISLAYFLLYKAFLDNKNLIHEQSHQLNYLNDCVSQYKSIHTKLLKQFLKQKEREEEQGHKSKRGKTPKNSNAWDLEEDIVTEEEIQEAHTNWEFMKQTRDQALPEGTEIKSHLKNFFPLLQSFAALRGTMQFLKKMHIDGTEHKNQTTPEAQLIRNLHPLLNAIDYRVSTAQEFLEYLPQYTQKDLIESKGPESINTFRDIIIEPLSHFPYEEFLTYLQSTRALFQEVQNRINNPTYPSDFLTEERKTFTYRLRHLDHAITHIQTLCPAFTY